jgi:hypothetical protein
MAKEVRFHLSVTSFSTVNKTLMRNIDWDIDQTCQEGSTKLPRKF